MPYLNIDDSLLYYEVHGAGAPVVLLHGVGGNHASWFYQIDAWSKKYRLITVDARGFGNSIDADGKGRTEFTNDLAKLLDHLAIDRAIIVAQSMGGGTAVDFTCRYPLRVASLVLADTLVWLDPTEAMVGPYREVLAQTASLTQSERVLGKTFRETEPALSGLYLQIASFNRYTFKTLVGEQKRYQPSAIAATGVPTCFVVGEEDVLFPPRLIAQAADDVPGSAFVTLPKAGHSAYFETPELFNEQVGAWIEKYAALCRVDA